MTWLMAIALTLGARAAAAEGTADHVASETQFRQGREALGKGDYQHALELFRASQTLEPGRGKLLNIALCEEKLGMFAAATRHFEQLLPDLPAGDDRKPIVKQHIAQLDPKVAHLRIVAPRGVNVVLDGVPLSPSLVGTDMAVEPGKHVIMAAAPGLDKRQYDTRIEIGVHASVPVQPGGPLSPSASPQAPVTAAPSAPPRDQSPSSDGTRVAGFVIGGIGLGALGAGAVTGGLAFSQHQSAENMCPSHKECSASTLSAASSGKTLSVVNTVALATGGAAAGLGIILIAVGGDEKPKASVALHVYPGGGGWTFKAAF